MAVVLGELSERPRTSDTERAWKAIEEIDWEEPEDRAGRILSQSIKKLLAKARAHRVSQTIPSQAHAGPTGDAKSPPGESYYGHQGSFDPALLGHNYHAPTNFVNVEDHHPQQFYIPQHVSPHDIAHQQPVANWYFDPSIQQLQDPEVGYPSDFWKGWDMIRDDPLQRRTG